MLVKTGFKIGSQRLSLEDLPHLLIAGTTGSGKTTLLRSIIRQLDCEVVLIDPKHTEFKEFADKVQEPATVHSTMLLNKMDLINPHPRDFGVVILLNQLIRTMDERYKEPADYEPIVIVVDELADLVMEIPGIEQLLIRIAQKGRAANMHLILATQRPSREVVSGLLKANVPSRLALRTFSPIDSRIILDERGAEKLKRGEALLRTPMKDTKLIRWSK